MTRDNEDRILVLQNSVDEMMEQLNKQKREIMEYKSKEVNSLEQISMVNKKFITNMIFLKMYFFFTFFFSFR